MPELCRYRRRGNGELLAELVRQKHSSPGRIRSPLPKRACGSYSNSRRIIPPTIFRSPFACEAALTKKP